MPALAAVAEQTPAIAANGLQRALADQGLLQSAGAACPYLSQFLLCGTHAAGTADVASSGIIVCGAQRIDQRVQRPLNRDYATTWNEWLELQQGADLSNRVRHPRATRLGDNLRFISTPRDLAGWLEGQVAKDSVAQARAELESRGLTV